MHFKGHWKGWALKIEMFLGPEMTTSEASDIPIRSAGFRLSEGVDYKTQLYYRTADAEKVLKIL